MSPLMSWPGPRPPDVFCDVPEGGAHKEPFLIFSAVGFLGTSRPHVMTGYTLP